jgi:hypothetical protein
MAFYQQIQEDGTNLTQRNDLNFATALTASDDAGNSRTNVNLAVTPTNDGGAIAKQSTTPGTQQTGNTNISGKGIVGTLQISDAGSVSAPSLQFGTTPRGFSQISDDDVSASAGQGASNAEYFRWGPDTRAGIPTTWFWQPVWVEKTLTTTGATGLDSLRVVPKVSAAGDNTIYQGLDVVNNSAGDDVLLHNGFFHGITVNVATKQSNDANEMAAAHFEIKGVNKGRIFGIDVTPRSDPNMTNFPAYVVGLNVIPFNDKKNGTNTTALWGALVSNGSNGRPVGLGGTSQALRIDRQSSQDTSTSGLGGTVTATNGSATVSGSGTLWTQVGVSPYINLVGKKIVFTADSPRIVYEIASVASDTSLTLTTSYAGSTGSSKSYLIRIAEPWLFGAYLSACESDAILVEQDPNFPPSGINTAFRVLNSAGAGNVYRFQYDGQLEQYLQSAATKGHLIRAAASQTGALAEFQNSSASAQSQIDAKGSLLTLESSRVAPWVEPQVAYGGAQFTASTSRTDCASVTFTPPSAVRLHITATWDIESTTISAGSLFVGELLVDGVAQSAALVWESKTNSVRTCLSRSWTPTLTAGSSHTIKTTAKLNVSGATYRINPTHTTLEISAIGRF